MEYFSGGANARFFVSSIRDEENLVIPTVRLYQVFKRVLLELSEEKALDALGMMSFGQVAVLRYELAIEAASISTETKLAMADSILLATTRANNATLWTQDSHFKVFFGCKIY